MIAWIAKLLGGSQLAAWLIVAALGATAFGSAYWYVDHKGYQRAAVEYQARYDRLVADYATAKTAEIERQNAANNAAKEREAARIAEIQEAADKLSNLQKELANEARQDPDAGKPVLGASSVQRINKVR